MATNESILEIVIRARNELKESLTDIKKQVDALSKSVVTPAVSPESTKHIDASQKSMAKLGEETKKTLDSIGSLAEGVKTLAKSFLALEIVKLISDLAKAAANEELLNASMHAVAASAGISSYAVDVLQKSLKDMGFASEAAATAINKFIRADLPIDKLEAFAKGAKNVATVAGTDAPSALNRLIFSVQNLTTRSLRQLGLNIDLAQTLRAYSHEHDVAVQAMDRHTKSLALLDEVQKEMDIQSKASAATQGLLAKEIGKLHVQTEEAKTAIGQGLIPLYQVFVQEGLTLAKNLQLVGDEFSHSGRGARSFAESIRPIVVLGREIVEFVVHHIEVLGGLAIAYAAVKITIIAVTTVVEGFTAALAANPVTATIIGLLLLGEAFVALYLKAKATKEEVEKADKAVGNTELIKKRKEALDDLARAQSWGHGYDEALAKLAEIDAEVKFINEHSKGLGISWEALVEKAVELQGVTTSRLELENKIISGTGKETDLLIQQRTEQIAAARSKEEELTKELTTLGDIVTKKGVANGLTVDAAKEQAKVAVASAQTIAKIREQTVAVQTLLERYKLGTEEAGKGLHLSEAFIAADNALNQMVEDFNKGLKDNKGNVLVTQGQIELMIEKFGEMPKTAEEAAAASLHLDEVMKLTGIDTTILAAKMRELTNSLAVKEAADKLKNYSDQLKGLFDTFSLLRGVVEDEARAQLTLEQSMAKAGFSMSAIATGLQDFRGEFVKTTDTIKAGVRAQIDLYKLDEQASKARYDGEIEQTQLFVDRQAELIRKSKLSEDEKAASIKALLQSANDTNLVSAQKYYADLKKSRDADLKDIAATNDRIIALQEKQFKLKQDREQANVDIFQKGMSESEKASDNAVRMEDALAKSQSARLHGNLDLAQKFADQALAFNQKIALSDDATAEEKYNAYSRVTAVFDEQDAIVKDQLTVEQSSRKAQINHLNAVKAKIEEITQTIEAIGDNKIVNLAVKLNISNADLDSLRTQFQDTLDGALKGSGFKTSLDTVRQQLQESMGQLKPEFAQSAIQNLLGQLREAFSSADLTIRVQMTQAKAAGGLIWGPGTSTSDSVPLWGSVGEYMVKEQAVSHYGVGFMEMINRMMLPMPSLALAEGGYVGPSGGGGGGGSRDMVDVTVNIGGNRSTLMGERSQVRNFVSSLKNLEGA